MSGSLLILSEGLSDIEECGFCGGEEETECFVIVSQKRQLFGSGNFRIRGVANTVQGLQKLNFIKSGTGDRAEELEKAM